MGKGPEAGRIVFFDELMEDPCNGPWRARQSQQKPHSNTCMAIFDKVSKN